MYGVLGKADRVISIEMFEHMKNYELLMKKVSNWIKPGGKVLYVENNIVYFQCVCVHLKELCIPIYVYVL